MKKAVMALAGLSLISAPVVAQSVPAIAPVSDESELGGGSAGIFAAAMIAGIVAMVVIVAADDDDEPASP